ncbi:MAG TPA: DNA repair protein RecN [Candidatus Lachnoclostridium avicola]|nr:DNA repair protein RecN [Candidatus Lachnoclostridium avicola]
MLLELHVRNLALIERADVEFGEGLNILTGETGSGKSIFMGSVNMALGGKVPRDMVRKGAEYAYIELIFSVDEEKGKILRQMGVTPDEDGILIISRKIMPSRSVSRINDETVTLGRLREITGLLLDIHGQHEHQSLLYRSKHLEILDCFAGVEKMKKQLAEEYRRYCSLEEAAAGFRTDEETRRREADFLRFEVDEIEDAALKPGEEEELSRAYRRFMGSRKIVEALSAAYAAVTAVDVGEARKGVERAAEYEEALEKLKDQLFDAEAILNDVAHEITSYLDNMVFDKEEFRRVESRLDLIHGLEAKYGSGTEAVHRALQEKKERLNELENYDGLKQKAEQELEESRERLDLLCEKLSERRKQAASGLAEKIRRSLLDLNFLDVEFEISFRKLDKYTAHGFDEVEFLISTNPGESVKPLGMVASGGELSRIMLAIKTVLADTDDVPTLIFDEIDTGISGRTAQKVSEKLAVISGSRQVICITHLPQIAAMADYHFEMAKEPKEAKTVTTIRRLDGRQQIVELARLLGGAEITDAVLQNAGEMKKLAEQTKRQLREYGA